MKKNLYIKKLLIISRILSLYLLCISCISPKEDTVVFDLFTNGKEVIYIDPDTDPLIEWAVEQLAIDIEKITGSKPLVCKEIKTHSEGSIIIGCCKDGLIKNTSKKYVNQLSGKWETFYLGKDGEELYVCGSDVRGTVYGVFELAERMGISPWIWWADVHPEKKKKITLQLPNEGITQGPSVQYRGIFLNDEDWGLQPWAAKTFEPETGDIGPKTYEKIFQLLLRLKANTIWPAMHPCTKAFYQIPGNNEMAQKYHIVVGTSHCEPMLRNNVDEWDHKINGDYNYFSNKTGVCQYWNDRIKQVKDAENIVTLGMRGIHDGHMHGGNSLEERTRMVEQIIGDQRQMLVDVKKKPIDSIATTVVLYKEVLDLYNKGMNIPEDVTIMWCDD
ncbi:MAG: glycosyl hydrolase 115 family protein, partial [Marinilabiliaceae bacterium]|nr:glycosyl hydrolase 115 family protein [Marinilabiliaceae bacterium]